MKKLLLLVLFTTSNMVAQEQVKLKSDSELESLIYNLYLITKDQRLTSRNTNSYQLKSIIKNRSYELSYEEANALLGKAKVHYTIISSFIDYLTFSSNEEGTVMGTSSYVGFDTIGNPMACKKATSGFKDYTYFCASVTPSIDYKGHNIFNWYLFNIDNNTLQGKFYISSDPEEAAYAFILNKAYDMHGTFYPKYSSTVYNETSIVNTTNSTTTSTGSSSTPPIPPATVTDDSNAIDTIKNAVLTNNNGKYDITGYFAYYKFSNDTKSNWTFTFSSKYGGDTYQLLGDTSEENIQKMGIFGWVKKDITPNEPLYYMVQYEPTPFGWLVFNIDVNGNCKNIYKLAGQDQISKSFNYDVDGDGVVDTLTDINCKVSSESVEFYSNTLPGM